MTRPAAGRQAVHRRGCRSSPRAALTVWLLRAGLGGPVLLPVLGGPGLLLCGCTTPQHQARQASLERWNRARAQVKTRLASDQLAAGHINDAATQLAEAARLDPASPELRTLQARICLARGDLAGAERALQEAAGQTPQPAEAEYLLGVIEQQRLRAERALERYLHAVAAAPQEITYLVAVVETMLQLGEAEGALLLLRSRADDFGWTPVYHAALAECCEQLGDWEAAAAAWQRVVAARADPVVRERLALALARCQRWAEAIPHLQALLDEQAADGSSQRPDEQPAVSLSSLRLALARCLLETRQASAAQTHLSAVLRDDPQNVPALQLLARAFAEQKEYELAHRTAEHALALEPNSTAVMELAAALACRAGDMPRALHLARLIQQAPGADSPVARALLAQATPALQAPEP